MNKVFYTDRIGYEDRKLLAAELHESCEQVSTLKLRYRGYEAGGFEYRDQVTLMHRGKAVFHGQVTDIEPSGKGLDKQTVVTVSNALWQMARLTLGEQLADLSSAEEEGTPIDWQVSANAAMGSWQALQGSCTSSASGWSVMGDGIRLDVSGTVQGVGRKLKRSGAVSQWTAMRALQQVNPGTVFRVDYDFGTVRVDDVFESDALVWDTSNMHISEVSLAPQYGSVLSGVAVAVSYDGEGSGSSGGVALVKYPPNISAADEGVRLFTAHEKDALQAAAQAAYMVQQLKAYFERASVLQNKGRILLSLADLDASPIGRRVVLTGGSGHEKWRDVPNMVTEVDWDLLRGTAEVSVGLSLSEPDLDTMTFVKADEGGSEGGGSEGGGGESGISSGGEGGGSGWEATTKDKTTAETSTGEPTTTTTTTTTGEPHFAVSMDGEVKDKNTEGFVWALTWSVANEADKRLITSTRLWIDNELVEGITPGDTAYSQRVEYGLHVAQVELTRADGAKASATATAFVSPETDEWPTHTGGETPTGGGGETPTGGGGTNTGEPIELEVSIGTDKRSNNYLLNITAVYSGGSGAPLQCIISTSPGNSVNRDSYSQECGYGIEYNWQVQVLDSSTGKDAVKSGTVMIPADEAPQTTTTGGTTGGGGDTPTGGGGADTPTGGEPPTGGDEPTGGGGDTPTEGGDTPTGGGDTPTPPTGGGGDTPAECPCDEKWTALEAWKASIEARISALENLQGNILARLTALEQRDPGTGGCDCDCSGLVAEIQAALNEAVQRAVQQAAQGAAAARVSAVTYSGSVTQDVETTATDTLRAVTTVSGVTAAGAGKAETSISYPS